MPVHLGFRDTLELGFAAAKNFIVGAQTISNHFSTALLICGPT
jgi:hypothetical protein